MLAEIGWLDLSVMVLYLLAIVGIGCYAGLRRKRHEGEANQYFLAAHSLRWPSIGMALFATNISCLHLVSLAQAGYDSGLLMGNFEWMAAFTLILLSLFFVPFYIRSKVATLPDFLEKRYCRQCRDWLAIVSVVAAIVTHIAFPLSVGWAVMHGVFGIDKWTCILVICSLTALYTVVGGLSAVVMTETVQAIVLIAGAVIITLFAWDKVEGWGAMSTTLQSTGEGVKLSVLRGPATEPQLPWYAIFLGYPVLGIWYWCADQTIVQRVLGAKDENHARVGPLFCAVIKILPVFIFVLPGLMFFAMLRAGKVDHFAQITVKSTGEDGTRTLVLTGAGASREYQLRKGAELDLSGEFPPPGKDRLRVVSAVPTARETDGAIPKDGMVKLPAHAEAASSKEVYGLMITSLLPKGLFGVLAAALMAALMGNLSSAANSVSTMFSYDLVKRYRPQTSEKSLVVIGRTATFVSFVIGVALVPLLDLYASVFAAINLIIAHIAPPITCVFLLGVFWKRASGRSAMWTMWLGSALGALLFAAKTAHDWKPGSFAWIPAFFHATPFMLMAFYMLCACLFIQITLTLLLPKLPGEDREKLYWEHPLDALKSAGWPGLGDYRVLAGLVFLIMVGLYIVFR